MAGTQRIFRGDRPTDPDDFINRYNLAGGISSRSMASDHRPTTRYAQRASVKTTYEVGRTLQPIYSGGSLALSEDGRLLAASLGEDVLLTDLSTGKELGRIEGDGEAITALTCTWFPSVHVDTTNSAK